MQYDVETNVRGPIADDGELEVSALRARVAELEQELAMMRARHVDESGREPAFDGELPTGRGLDRDDELASSRTLLYFGLLIGEVARSSGDLLTVTLSYTELALGELDAAHPVAGWLREMRDAAVRNEALTKCLVAASRRRSAELELVAPRLAVRRAEPRLRDRLKMGQTLEVDDRAACLVHADLGLLILAFELLVDNAIEAMDGPGVVRIVLEERTQDVERTLLPATLLPGEHLVLRIEDTGPGIDPAAYERVFDPFFSTRGDLDHPGLGLSICDVIARVHGGAIRVVPCARGGAIELLLPCAEASLGGVPPHERLEPDDGPTILLVEDEFPVRQLSRRILMEAGYRVLAAASGHEALEIARRHAGPIDLLVTDVVMPQLSGPELAAMLRDELPQLGVLYVSGFAPEYSGDRGSLDASVDLLAKPFYPDDLLSRVRVAVARSKRIAESSRPPRPSTRESPNR